MKRNRVQGGMRRQVGLAAAVLAAAEEAPASDDEWSVELSLVRQEDAAARRSACLEALP